MDVFLIKISFVFNTSPQAFHLPLTAEKYDVSCCACYSEVYFQVGSASKKMLFQHASS